MSPLAELASRHCAPLKGAEHRLPETQCRQWLAALPGWELVENGEAIAKTFRFEDYYRTMAFVNALAFVAHREDHHPDLAVGYAKVEVVLTTHSVSGLSENDFICAARIDALGAA